MTRHHLAQVNIAVPLAPLDDPLLADFVEALDPINALADAAPGFVWRLQDDDGNATAIRAFDSDQLIVNMSVWASLEALGAYVYSGPHLQVMRQRRRWFTHLREAYTCLWWVPAGNLPGVPEAELRLEHLRRHGPTPHAFTFSAPFPAPHEDVANVVPRPDDWLCPA